MKSLRCLLLGILASLAWNAPAAEPFLATLINNGLFEPYGVATDADMNYYLTDSSHRVFRYVPDTGILTNIAGVKGVPGYVEGPGLLAQFNAPRAIVSFRGGLAVADSGNHLVRFMSNPTSRIPIVSTLAGSINQPGPASDGPANAVSFNAPVGLATDGTRLFIADSKNNAIRMLYPQAGIDFVKTIAANLHQPSGLALDGSGNLYFCDTRTNQIQVLKPQPDGTYTLSLLAGTVDGSSGSNDSFFGDQARFNSPNALAWITIDPANPFLLVSDSGNHTLRQVYRDPDLVNFFGADIWSVVTYAGLATQPGYVDGVRMIAQLNSPAEMKYIGPVGQMNVLVVDTGNNALREIQPAAPTPQVGTPVIGVVKFVVDPRTGDLVSKLTPITTPMTFNNEALVAIAADAEVMTLYSIDGKPPVIGVNAKVAPFYQDGMLPAAAPASIVTSGDVDISAIIMAVSQAEGRRPSQLAEARIKYQVGAASVSGNNAASFIINSTTVGATMWYKWVDPSYSGKVTNIFSSLQFPDNPHNLFQVPSGQPAHLPFPITTPTNTIWIQGRLPNFQDGDPVPQIFYQSSANQISFGFAPPAEASCSFIAMPGQTFFVPVTLSLLDNKQKMYSLQFNVLNTGLGAAPIATDYGFESFLEKPDPENPGTYLIIPPAFVVPPQVATNSLEFTNSTLLGVGWLERAGATNLYDTRKQDLITYSQPHDRIYSSSGDQKVILGGYSFKVPLLAAVGQQYQIHLGRPSATADGISQEVYIDALTGGPLGAGEPNALKNVTVGQTNYIAGDVAPFRWFNAGDFGDGEIRNNDVLQIFQSAVYFLNRPPTNSDCFNAMDVSDGSAAGRLDANPETAINDITQGDDQLNVDDIYVAFRRSLNPSLTNIVRYWSNGSRSFYKTNNLFYGLASLQSAKRPILRGANLPAGPLPTGTSTDPATVRFFIDDVGVEPGQTIPVPVRAQITGKYPVRVLMLSLKVEPLDGSPPITVPAKLTAVSTLGTPAFSDSRNAANAAAAWLDESVDGVWGTNVVGTLQVTIPPTATTTSAYRISFAHVSASPNGLGLLPNSSQAGLLSVADRQTSSWHDGIPDSWRLRYFGSVSNVLSAASADPDGDGVPNWAEYQSGTNPMDKKSALRLTGTRVSSNATSTASPVLRWPTTAGLKYSVECSASLASPQWAPLSTEIIGTGADLEYLDLQAPAQTRYYRVRVAQ